MNQDDLCPWCTCLCRRDGNDEGVALVHRGAVVQRGDHHRVDPLQNVGLNDDEVFTSTS